jgi:hypothetical protein
MNRATATSANPERSRWRWLSSGSWSGFEAFFCGRLRGFVAVRAGAFRFGELLGRGLAFVLAVAIDQSPTPSLFDTDRNLPLAPVNPVSYSS